jgi:hypothetical protein
MSLECKNHICPGPDKCVLREYFTQPPQDSHPQETATAVETLGNGCPIVGDVIEQFADIYQRSKAALDDSRNKHG